MRQIKDSGIEWIGEIPRDWQLLKIGSIFKCRNVKVNDTDYSPLSVSRGGIVPQMENVAKSDANDNRKQVLINDFVINSRSDRKQSCGVSQLDGSVSLINTVLYMNKETILTPTYTNFLMKNYGFAEEYYRWGHGIVADLWTTRWQEMKNIVLPIPTIDTQKIITEAINKKMKALNQLLINQEQQIEKLKAYKQSVITEAVTKGLDPTAPMKDSGVKWIGNIPRDWQILRLKYVADLFQKGYGITKEDIFINGDTPCVRYGDIYTKYKYNFSKCLTRTNRDRIGSLQYFSHGDVLFTATGELVEEIGKSIAYIGEDKCLVGGDVIVMKHRQDPLFIGYALDSDYSQKQKSFGKAKLKVVHISAEKISNLYFALPQIEEQKLIANFLKEKCDKVDRLIDIKQQKIEKLQFYKKSLIYEYVTGKKEVSL